ncbi:MAG: dienelactone hydrolase family protein [Candidatus Dormibacteraeota bacterium]|nr:dienelactone hydrolase family protein [Candidatus Dormibacteraeota bacterium]
MCHPEVPAGQPVPEVDRQEVEVPLSEGGAVPALLARPESGTGPGVMVVADVFGRTPFYEALAARLATAGFEALLPDFFHRVGPPAAPSREAVFARRGRLDDNRALEDLRACLGWMRSRPGYSGHVGTLGFCLGGTFVLDLAALEPDLVTVCYYGFPQTPGERKPGSAPTPMELVEHVGGPVLGFWGDQDSGVGMENVAEYDRRMKAAGKDFVHHVYPGLGHGFMAASGLEPGNDAYEKACESWTLALNHWRRNLVQAVAI